MALPRPSHNLTPSTSGDQEAREAFEQTLAEETTAPTSSHDDEAAYQQAVAQGEGMSTTKKVALGVAGVLVASAAGAGVWLLGPGGGFQGNDTRNPGVVSTPTDTSTGKSNPAVKTDAGATFWRGESGPIWPIQLNDWERRAASISSDKKALVGQVNQKYAASELYSTAQTLPSKATGFTSDPKASTNADGTINPRFSFLLAEDMQYLVASDLEFFVNPAFGDWVNMQYAANKPSQKFQLGLVAGKYSRQAMNTYKDTPFREWVPIYADWDANNYGQANLLAEGPRWMGKVMGTKTDLKYDQATLQYNAHVVAEVLYTAWLQDGNTVTKKGEITLDYVTNSENPNALDRKMLISKSSLKLTG